MGWVLPIIIGMSWHLPSPEAVPHHPSDSAKAFFPHSLTGMRWCQKILQWYGISFDIALRGSCRKEDVWAHCGVSSPLSSQHSHFRWGGNKIHLTQLFWLQLGLHFHAFQWGCLLCPSPKAGSLKCHDWWDALQHLMQVDPPIRGLSTFVFGGPSVIPQRTEWVPSSGNNISTQITSSQHECAQWWTHFLASGPLPVHDGRTWVQGPISQQWFNIYFPTHPTMASPPKAESQVSMTMEVSELLPWAALDTSGQALGSSTLKRPVSTALGAPSISAKPMDTSSQASLQESIPEDAEPGNQTLEEVYAPPSLLVKTPGPGAGILPGDVIQLQKEAKRALGHLLATSSSVNACWRKWDLDFEMVLHQNESETTEAIKEAKALCASTIRSWGPLSDCL